MDFVVCRGVARLAQVIAKFGLLLWPTPYAAVVLATRVTVAIGSIAGSVAARSRASTRARIVWFVLTGLFNSAAVLALYTALDRGAVNVVSPIAATYPMLTLVLNAYPARGAFECTPDRRCRPYGGGVVILLMGFKNV
jgi:uncharacterized membrane protein